MSSAIPPSAKKRELTLSVANEAQARELEAAWLEIVSGKSFPRLSELATGEEAVLERARTALATIETAIREHPTSGQTAHLVRFLAAIYNGYDYAFDLTDLRALDTTLANACLDYLNYDRLAKREVHHHLEGGDEALQRWIRFQRIGPRLTLDEDQQGSFMALAEKTGRAPNDLLGEAVAALLDKHASMSAKLR